MGDLAIPNRLVVEGEHLVAHIFPSGSVGLVSATEVLRNDLNKGLPKGSLLQRLKRLFAQDDSCCSPPIQAVCVPSGTHLILKAIPGSLQQRCGLKDEEGAVFEQANAEVNAGDTLRFYNGVEIGLQELRVGQVVEVLSLVGTHPMLYEREFQMR